MARWFERDSGLSRAPAAIVAATGRLGDHNGLFDPGVAPVVDGARRCGGMITWLVRRLIQAVFVVLAMTVIVFVGVHVIGNPVDILISPEADQAERARIIAALGLDQPLWRQYLVFVGDALHGNLGRSFVFNEPALKLIAQRMPATMELAVTAVLLSVLIGVPLGLYAGLKPDGWIGRSIMAGSILGFSLPTFWVGLMLIMVFAVQLGWLPSTGRGQTAMLFGVPWSFLTWDGLRHMFLPALNLSLFNISLVLRLTRAGVRETLPMDFIKFARAKGLRLRRRAHPVRVFRPVRDSQRYAGVLERRLQPSHGYAEKAPPRPKVSRSNDQAWSPPCSLELSSLDILLDEPAVLRQVGVGAGRKVEAAGPSLPALHFRDGYVDASFARTRVLGCVDPANPFPARHRRNALP